MCIEFVGSTLSVNETAQKISQLNLNCSSIILMKEINCLANGIGLAKRCADEFLYFSIIYI